MRPRRYTGDRRKALYLLACGEEAADVADALCLPVETVFGWLSDSEFLHAMACEAAFMELRAGRAAGTATLH